MNKKKRNLVNYLPHVIFEKIVFIYVCQRKGILLTLLSLGLLVLALSAELKVISGKISETKMMVSENFVIVTLILPWRQKYKALSNNKHRNKIELFNCGWLSLISISIPVLTLVL